MISAMVNASLLSGFSVGSRSGGAINISRAGKTGWWVRFELTRQSIRVNRNTTRLSKRAKPLNPNMTHE